MAAKRCVQVAAEHEVQGGSGHFDAAFGTDHELADFALPHLGQQQVRLDHEPPFEEVANQAYVSLGGRQGFAGHFELALGQHRCGEAFDDLSHDLLPYTFLA